jgi:hypothetical protein
MAQLTKAATQPPNIENSMNIMIMAGIDATAHFIMKLTMDKKGISKSTMVT